MYRWLWISVASVLGLLWLALYAMPVYFQQADIRAAQTDQRLLNRAEAVPKPGQRNLFPALWLLPYDVPLQEVESMMRAQGAALMYSHEVPAVLRARQRDRDGSLAQLACNNAENGACLEDIRQRLPEYRALLQQYRSLIEHIDALADYEALYGADWLAHWDVLAHPLPKFHYLFFGRNAAMVEYLDGDTPAALQRSCRQIKLGQTLAGQSDNLVGAMVGNALMDRNLSWLAQMLAAQPQWAQRLPEPCTQVLATPLSADSLTLCRAFKGEYRLMAVMLQRLAADGELPGEEAPELAHRMGIAWHPAHTQALAARHYAAYCQPSVHTWAQQDAPERVPRPYMNYRTRWACWHNIAGCSAFWLSDTDLDEYRLRLADTEMRRRAVQAAVAVYRLPEPRSAAAIEAALAQQQSPARSLHWDAAQRRITYPVYSAQYAAAHDIPLSVDARP